MDEFEFLDNMFNRLREARHFRAEDERTIQPIKQGRKEAKPHSPWETVEIMLQMSIRDYLAMRK